MSITEATGKEIIRMSGICRSYQMGSESLQVLNDVNFSVCEGEFVSVLGPSGSGKSTLMNIIGCMDKASKGEYYLGGSAVHKMNDRKMTRIRNSQIGFVFQKYHLISQYNVLQNIIMPLVIRGIPHRKAQEMAMESICLLGLEGRLKHKPNELSGGQQQRVAIARALVGKPAILLADEPTGALDSTTSKEVLKLFVQLNELGNTIIMITHDLSVASNGKRIVHIDDGRLYGETEPEIGERPAS
ncbi:ABC transporter ATP-binding protein [Ruminococcaceae bacterium OttesenSCG-928-L11]|nr:ABC transporter ATP-binding protein [Ruminococcaceae bacterium OttesenSCG-928-L11]